jgi:hypothetical protein
MHDVKQLPIGVQESFAQNPHTVGPSAAGLGAGRRGNGKHHMRGNCRNIMRHNCRRQQRDYCQPENYRRHLSTTHNVRQLPTIFTCFATFGLQVSLCTEYMLCETTANICETSADQHHVRHLPPKTARQLSIIMKHYVRQLPPTTARQLPTSIVSTTADNNYETTADQHHAKLLTTPTNPASKRPTNPASKRPVHPGRNRGGHQREACQSMRQNDAQASSETTAD